MPECNDPKRTKDDDTIPRGLFSRPQIEYCIKKYKILENIDEECIREATYDMRLGKIAIRWDGTEKKEFDVEADKHVLLEPNSVTFVTTIERFDLPYDIVARFNLKSGMVHRGLLLGTGPIVDPGFQSKILIPIHNFSNQPVTIRYEERFISVEFTRCCSPYETYVIDDNTTTKTRFNEKGLLELSNFIAGTVRTGSSIKDAIEKYKEQQDRSEKIVERTKNIVTIAIATALIGMFTLLFNVFNSVNSYTDKINSTLVEIEILKEDIKNLKSALESKDK